ncbi:helix-turn-helix domain-containing protein [Bacillus pacificus]|uniref:helix-turn-helix domain-containing protein n=1 Tax=Bacillus pacificus TaxID=2026187 RepID=UPI003D1B1229
MTRNIKTTEEILLAELVGRNIKYLMKARGLRQTDLSELTGMPRSTVSDYVNGCTVQPLQALYRISKVLNVKLADLVNLENEHNAFSESDVFEISSSYQLENDLKQARQRNKELEDKLKQITAILMGK